MHHRRLRRSPLCQPPPSLKSRNPQLSWCSPSRILRIRQSRFIMADAEYMFGGILQLPTHCFVGDLKARSPELEIRPLAALALTSPLSGGFPLTGRIQAQNSFANTLSRKSLRIVFLPASTPSLYRHSFHSVVLRDGRSQPSKRSQILLFTSNVETDPSRGGDSTLRWLLGRYRVAISWVCAFHWSANLMSGLGADNSIADVPQHVWT